MSMFVPTIAIEIRISKMHAEARIDRPRTVGAEFRFTSPGAPLRRP